MVKANPDTERGETGINLPNTIATKKQSTLANAGSNVLDGEKQGMPSRSTLLKKKAEGETNALSQSSS